MNLGIIFGLFLLTGCFSAPGYQGPVSPHFDGKHFFNAVKRDSGLGDFLKWQLTKEREFWPETVDVVKPAVPSKNIPDSRMEVYFINHATMLIRVDGFNILTDPIWSERCSPVTWAGPKRLHPPGISFDDLPKIDAVVVSHNHYDHMDIETLKKLDARDKPVVLAGLGNSLFLKKEGVSNVVDLDWWQSHVLHEKLKIEFVPTQHFSGRGLGDRNQTLWGAFVFASKRGPILFAGDTGYSDHFKQIEQKFGAFFLSILPIGAYKPRWFMDHVHVDPNEAVLAHLDLNSRLSIGMHFGTFNLADEGFEAPTKDLEVAKQKHRLADDAFVTLKPGEGRFFEN